METKLNDSCPLGRELDTDELENVSGGDGFYDAIHHGHDGSLGSAVGGLGGGTSGGTPGGIQAGANAALNQLGIK
jgi:bacteriocin-like protein